MTQNRGEFYRQFKAVDSAHRAGDIAALKEALGDPPGFPNCLQPWELGVGDYPLEYAIYWSPLPAIEALIALGADPNYPDQDGFPSLIAALSSGRADRHEVLRVLLDNGADVDLRGQNDWTPLHYAVGQRDLEAVGMLLRYGADPALKTRIDDCTTSLEDAEGTGFEDAAKLLWKATPRTGGDQG